MALENDPQRSNMDFILVRRRGAPPLNIDGLPIVKLPWGRITAIDLNEGEIVWQVAHGETPDNIREHPALQGVTIPRTGQVGRIGTLVTKTLVIAGDCTLFTTPSGEEGAMLRAYDKVHLSLFLEIQNCSEFVNRHRARCARHRRWCLSDHRLSGE